jgi:cytochrome c5
MRTRAFYLRAACAALIATGVACTSRVPVPSQADAVRAGQRWPDADLGSLSEGREVYIAKCAGCHLLKPPGALSPEAWPASLSRMRVDEDVAMSEREAELVLRYLVTLSEISRR